MGTSTAMGAGRSSPVSWGFGDSGQVPAQQGVREGEWIVVQPPRALKATSGARARQLAWGNDDLGSVSCAGGKPNGIRENLVCGAHWGDGGARRRVGVHRGHRALARHSQWQW